MDDLRDTPALLARVDWRAVLEAGPWAYLLLTANDYRIVGVSDAYARATNTERDTIVGKYMFDVFPDDPSEPAADGTTNLRASLDRVRETRQTDVMAVQRYPVRRPAAAGGGFEERYWSPVNAPVLDAEGNVVYIVHRVEDVTEFVRLKHERGGRNASDLTLRSRLAQIETDIVLRSHDLQRLNERLRRSEARFRGVFTGAATGIAVMAPNGRILEANPALQSMLGYTEAELSECTLASLIHADDRQAHIRRLDELLGGMPEHLVAEMRYVRKDATVGWLRLSASVVRTPTAEPVHVIAVTEDISAQKLAQERLRETEHLLEIAGRVARVGGWRVDLRENVVVLSDEVCDIHGLPHGTRMSTDEGIAFYAPEWRRVVADAFTACATRAIEYDLEAEIVSADARRVWVRTIGRPVRDQNGTIVQVQGAFQDISRRKAAEERARSVTEQLTRTLENLDVAFLTLDHDWKFTYVNRQAESLLGRTREQLLGRTLWQEFPAAVDSSFDREYRRAIREQQPVQFEEAYTPLGLWLEVSAFPVPDGLAVQFRDITERRVTARRLAQQAALLDQAQDAIIARTLDNRITYWNRGAERLYGWTAEEAIGRDARTLLYENPEPFDRAAAQVLENGMHTCVLRQLRKDGETVFAEARWSLVRDEKGNPSGVFAINTDITEKKKLEAQFLRAQRMESIGTLAGGIAHDLNNLLVPVFWGLELIRRMTANERILTVAANMEQSAKRAAELVNQVLSFARGVEGAREHVSVTTVVAEIRSIIDTTFPRNLSIDVEIENGVWPVVADPTQISQVLMNLAVNARDAMPEGGRLRIAASNMTVDEHYAAMHGGVAAGAYVVLEVSDTGRGIPQDVIDRIFEPFFTTKGEGRGSGLGLSTVQAIVRSHDGFVSVYSEPGEGSAFHVYLPARPEGRVDVSSHPLPPPQSVDGGGELILVVDDEESILNVTQQTLELCGYRVVTAQNGADAIGVFARLANEVSVVVSDMMMPVMDGATLIAALRKIRSDVPIIATSGLAAPRGTSGEATFDTFLPKPFTAHTLLRTLDSLLHRGGRP